MEFSLESGRIYDHYMYVSMLGREDSLSEEGEGVSNRPDLVSDSMENS
jgi:hypothetical protein